MPEITIDANICKKDGLCTLACNRAVFHQEEKNTVPVIEGQERCFSCGQCVSICPAGAISHSDYPKGTGHSIIPEYIPNYDQLLELIRSRRSKRLFKEKTVTREVIEKVLDAARFAPTASNAPASSWSSIPATFSAVSSLSDPNGDWAISSRHR